MKMYKPSRKSEIEKSNRPDGEVIHKTKKYENIYNKLFRKFEYNRVLTMALSTNIRFVSQRQWYPMIMSFQEKETGSLGSSSARADKKEMYW